MTEKEAYENKLQAQLDEWSAEIDKLKAKAQKAESEVQIEYYEKINELESLKENATLKLLELKNSSDNAWSDIKIGVESAWDSLGKAIGSAVSRFK